ASPNLIPPHVDGGVLALAVLLAASVTLLAGIAPALYGSREDSTGALHETGRSTGGVHATRVRGVLVAGEMALAVVALVAAGLFYQSFRHSRHLTPGFDASQVGIASVSITLAGYDSARGEAFL